MCVMGGGVGKRDGRDRVPCWHIGRGLVCGSRLLGWRANRATND